MLTRALLLLLSAFFLSWGAEYHIDLKHCGKITTCFAHDVCVKDALNSQNLVELTNIEDFKDENCDVIMQIRPFSGSKWHIMVQVNATQYTHPLDDTGISFFQDGVQFACKKSGPTGNMIDFKIEKLGDGKFEERLLFCSFTFETHDASLIESKFTNNDNDPKFVVNTMSLVFSEPNSKFWRMKVTCNPEDIKSSIIPSEEFLQTQIDKYSFPPIKCEPPKSLLITRVNASPTLLQESTELSCKSKFWSYIGTSEIAIPKKEKFDVVCAERFCSRCAPLGNIEIAGGTKPTNGTSDGGCATTTCTDKPWMIDNNRVLNGAMKCEKEEGALTSSWYLKTGNESIKVTKASCVDTRICMTNFEPTEKCPDFPAMVCQARTKSADGSEFSCTNDFKLKWAASGNSGAETTSIKCDFTSGKFVDAKGNQLPSGSSVYCTKPGPPIEEAEAAGKGEKPPSSAGTVIGGIVGGLVLLGLVVGLIVIIVIRRRRIQHKEIADTANVKTSIVAVAAMPED